MGSVALGFSGFSINLAWLTFLSVLNTLSGTLKPESKDYMFLEETWLFLVFLCCSAKNLNLRMRNSPPGKSC